MTKVVIDTNILINASSDENSVAFKIVKEVIDGRITAFATHQTMSENRQMLRKLVRDREYKILLEDFFRYLQIVTPTHSPPREGERQEGVMADKEDLKLLESSLAAHADYLITNDREVLDVEEYFDTQIVTPGDFWAKYKADSSDDGSAWGDWSKMLMGS